MFGADVYTLTCLSHQATSTRTTGKLLGMSVIEYTLKTCEDISTLLVLVICCMHIYMVKKDDFNFKTVVHNFRRQAISVSLQPTAMFHLVPTQSLFPSLHFSKLGHSSISLNKINII